MRYVAKMHILDVMDKVVLSGYVFDADDMSDPDHVAHEFTWEIPGRGVNDPMDWLLDAVARATLE